MEHTQRNKIRFDKRRYHELGEMSQWCRENIGPGGYIDEPEYLWTMTTMFGETDFIFKDEKHAEWFALRWA
jgi:hypothetical protein